MKQEAWIDIMVGSVVDQVERARKTAKRMATFFERQGDSDKAKALTKVSEQLERAMDDSLRVYKEVQYQGPIANGNSEDDSA